jgi:hypothetical protein
MPREIRDERNAVGGELRLDEEARGEKRLDAIRSPTRSVRRHYRHKYRLGGYRFEHGLGNVEVRVDVLDVVRFLEPVDEIHDPARSGLV